MNLGQLLQWQFELSGELKVGDTCVWQNLTGDDAALNGTETTIVGVHQYRAWSTSTWRNGLRCAAEAGDLRKKYPPRREVDAIVSWSDCLWSPE